MSFLSKFFSFERSPCQIMADLSLKPLPVYYGPAIINGSFREARIKIWRVAVHTVEPDVTCPTHTDWLDEIHAEIALQELLRTT